MTPSNTLYCGDNLEVLRKHPPDESVDLISLDSPFNNEADASLQFAHRSWGIIRQHHHRGVWSTRLHSPEGG
ncbi:MAG: hypothetical protein RMK45_00045 [Armatimonadota bacterium]|nr:hypothetical protein [Armatimonadota bacterium]